MIARKFAVSVAIVLTVLYGLSAAGFKESATFVRITNDASEGLYDQLLLAFKQHGFEIRESTDLDDQFHTLDSSDFHGRQFLKLFLPWAWGMDSFSAKEGQVLGLVKGGEKMLVEGGDGVRYQPLKNTKKITKFKRSDLEHGKNVKFGKELLVHVKDDEVVYVESRSKNIILKPGFHWLKANEKIKARKTIYRIKREIEKECQTKEGEYITGCIASEEIWKYSVLAVYEPEPNEIAILHKSDGSLQSLQPGWYLYRRDALPTDWQATRSKISKNWTTQQIPLPQLGVKVTVSFNMSIVSEREYGVLAKKDEHAPSYPEFVISQNGLTDHGAAITRKLMRALQAKFGKPFEDAQNIDLDSDKIEQVVKSEILKANVIPGLKFTYRSINLDTKEMIEHLDRLRRMELKRAIDDADRENKRAEREYDIESQEATIKLEKKRTKVTRRHEIKKTWVESKPKRDQAKALITHAKAKRDKQKRVSKCGELPNSQLMPRCNDVSEQDSDNE